MTEQTVTADDLRSWVEEHREYHGVVSLAEIAEETKDWPPLRRRITGFLHELRLAMKIVEASGGQCRWLMYEILKNWISTLVGWDAPKSEYVEGGYGVLLKLVIEKLEL